MKCLLCNNEMRFEEDGEVNSSFHSFNCYNEGCNFSIYYDAPPFEEISEYDLQFNLNDKHYSFSSTNSEWKEYVTHNPITTIRVDNMEIIELDYYVPFVEDLTFYENFVKRIMGLKAFL